MKQKLLALLLSAAMLFSLNACGSNELTDAIIDVGLELAADALLDDDTSVGVIGGADGPTSVLVTDGEESVSGTLDKDTGEIVPDSDAVPETGDSTSSGSGSLYEELPAIDEDGTYNSAEDVSLYLYTYGCLPDNYLTKNEARAFGWSGGSVEDHAGEGAAIGGDRFQNKEKALPIADGRLYYECDIDTWGKDERGPERIVWSNDGLIYYTPDHYASFVLLYGEE